MAFEPLLGNKAAKYDPTKITYIGSANDEVSVCMAWHTSGIATFEDVQERELVVGAGGTADDTYQFPAILNNMFGAKFKMVTGYAGGTEINIAMERGEVHGRCGFPWSTVKASHQHWMRDKSFNLLMQFSLAKHADLPDVPLVMDLARNDEERQILRLIFGRQVMGRPYVAPPGVPEGPRRRAAQGVHGDDGGQGLPRRRRQGAVRDHRGVGREARERWCSTSTGRRRLRSRRRRWRW